jgi:hypothetical protein
MQKYAFVFVLILTVYVSSAQDLLDIFEEEEVRTELVEATFKSTRIINAQSVVNPPGQELLFIISHRFGAVNGGFYELFGIDQSSVRFGFEYGLSERLALGIGRSSYLKNYDAFVKYRILRQSKGEKAMPLSMSWFSSIAVNSLKWQYPQRENLFSSRLSYTHQLLIARKFSSRLSVQLLPTYVHKNLVPTSADENDVFALGAGGRLKLSNRVSLNAEYFYLLPGKTADDYVNSLSLGVDIETGGHVFQLHFTNSLGMFETAFVSQTNERWLDGGIHFGFNVTRVFSL